MAMIQEGVKLKSHSIQSCGNRAQNFLNTSLREESTVDQWFGFESYPGQPTEERPWSHRRIEVRDRDGRSFFTDPYAMPKWLNLYGKVWRPAPECSTAEAANERTTISPTL